MSETRLSTRVVRVKLEERHPGLFYATSPDLRGLFVAKQSLQEVIEALPESIRALYAVGGEAMIVEAVGEGREPHEWVVMPVGAAEAALAHTKRHPMLISG